MWILLTDSLTLDAVRKIRIEHVTKCKERLEEPAFVSLLKWMAAGRAASADADISSSTQNPDGLWGSSIVSDGYTRQLFPWDKVKNKWRFTFTPSFVLFAKCFQTYGH
jgi:hypothetical protein